MASRSLRTATSKFCLLSMTLWLASCGGGGGSSSDTATPAPTPPPAGAAPPSNDTSSPQVSSRAPDDQADEVSTTAKVVVLFNEALDAGTVNAETLTVTQQAVPVAGSVLYDPADRSLVFTPTTALTAETVYGVTLANTVRDMAGNAFLGESWFFTTGGPFNLGPTTQTAIDQCMEDGDKTMLTLVNTAREAGAVCGSDTMPPQPALGWNCLLDAAAAGHSTSMATNDFHEHTSPVDGSTAGDRIRATGYTPRTWGENIAAGYADEDRVMEGWLTSPGHCRNLLNAGYTEMGAGYSENPGSTYGIYWTQNFGAPR